MLMFRAGGLTEKWHLIVWLPVVFIVRVLTLVMSRCIANLTSGDTLSSISFCVLEFKLKAAAICNNM